MNLVSPAKPIIGPLLTRPFMTSVARIAIIRSCISRSGSSKGLAVTAAWSKQCPLPLRVWPKQEEQNLRESLQRPQCTTQPLQTGLSVGRHWSLMRQPLVAVSLQTHASPFGASDWVWMSSAVFWRPHSNHQLVRGPECRLLVPHWWSDKVKQHREESQLAGNRPSSLTFVCSNVVLTRLLHMSKVQFISLWTLSSRSPANNEYSSQRAREMIGG